jgi:hypothetical protein
MINDKIDNLIKELEELKSLIYIKDTQIKILINSEEKIITIPESLNVSEAAFLYGLLSEYYINDKGPENFINAYREAKYKALLYLISHCENIEKLRIYANELIGIYWNEYGH